MIIERWSLLLVVNVPAIVPCKYLSQSRSDLIQMIIERWSLLLIEHVSAIVPEILACLTVHWHQVRTAPRLAIYDHYRYVLL